MRNHPAKSKLTALFLFLSLLAGCVQVTSPTSGGSSPSSSAEQSTSALTDESASDSAETASDETTASESTAVETATEETTAAEPTAAPSPSPAPQAEPALDDSDFIYFIMTDRFHDGDPANNGTDTNPADPRKRHGGDFAGILDKLDYIESLGATAIWITPVLENTPDGYHGYWIKDFRAIDPHLGTIDELEELVTEAHSRDIKVLVDYVINHTGAGSELVNDPEKADWFHPDRTISDFSDREQRENGWLYGLPDFDQSNPEVDEYLTESALWLIEETGIDGFRMDTVMHVPGEYSQTFTDAIRVEYPGFYFLGEAFSLVPSVIKYYQGFGLDGMLNYPVYDGLRQSLSRTGDTSALKSAIGKDQELAFHELNGNFFDNHDNTRLMTYLLQSTSPDAAPQRFKQALAFLMTYEGIPVLYYGSEIGMEGGSDPDNRRDMDFEAAGELNTPADVLTQNVTLLGELRASGALEAGGGAFELLETGDEVIAWKHGDVLTVLNFSSQTLSVELDEGGRWQDLFGAEETDFDASGGVIELAPWDVKVLTPVQAP